MSFHLKKTWAYVVYVVGWFLVNLLTLVRYPIMHSDEAWLAGLSRTMMDRGTLLTTEPFFDMAPRAPHTLKVLYHLFQMPLIKIFGYELFSIRLLSLIFGTLTVIFLMMLFDKVGYTVLETLMALTLITLSSQFIYASHFARQEILLVALLIAGLYLYKALDDRLLVRSITIGTIIGIGIMVHPNAFFLAVMIGLVFLWDWFRHKITFSYLFSYALPMALIAILNIIITLNASTDFLSNYWQYASELQVGADPASRAANFLSFYVKLWHQISGTYFLTDLRWVFIAAVLAIISVLIAGIIGYKRSEIWLSHLLFPSILMILGFNIALFIIGRYNQTSIIFSLLPMLILVAETFRILVPGNIRPYIMGAVALFAMNLTYSDYNDSKYHDYSAYTGFLQANIKEDDRVFGNLSGGLTMAPDQFYDIRNLAYYDSNIEDYFIDNKIDTLIWYEEYDYLHRNPQWQILYGPDDDYYGGIKNMLEDHGTLRAETTSTHYGNRIIRYQDGYPWKIWIYDLDF